MKNRRTLPRQYSFNNAFRLEGRNRMLPAGVYQTDIEEVFLEGDGKPAYHRYQVKIHLPETAGGAQPFLALTPANFDALCQRDRDLTQAAHERDEMNPILISPEMIPERRPEGLSGNIAALPVRAGAELWVRDVADPAQGKPPLLQFADDAKPEDW